MHTCFNGNGNTFLAHIFKGKWLQISCTLISREITIHFLHTYFKGNGSTFFTLTLREMTIHFSNDYNSRGIAMHFLHTYFKGKGYTFLAHFFQCQWQDMFICTFMT